MQRGCFVWTPTPPLAGQRTPRPGSVRGCLWLLFLAGLGGPASRAGFGAPHLSCGRRFLLLCSAPSKLGLPFACRFVCLSPPFSFLFPLSLCPPVSLAFFVFRPRVPWALALCPPAPAFGYLFFVSLWPAWFRVCFLPPSFSSFPPVSLFLFFFFLPFPTAFFVLWVCRCGPFAAPLRLLPLCPPLVCVSRLSWLPLGVPCFPSAALLLPPCLALVGGSCRLLPTFPPPHGARVVRKGFWFADPCACSLYLF